MPKIIVDSDEYIKLKEKLNKLSDINKSLKEKYTQLQKKSIIDTGFSVEKYNKLKTENENLKKDITFHKQETNKLEKEKRKLLYDISLLKNENKQLKSNINELENKNNNLNFIKNTYIEQNNKEGISICLTAWQTQDYIEECLDSIENQTYFENFNNYEILLGIDGCEQTLEKVKSIQHKYRNLRVFMMNKNVGTYITTNTLMSIAKYNWLLRFDTDDVMLPDMISNIMKLVNTNVILRCSFKNFGKNLDAKYKKDINFAYGIIVFNKNVFYTLGGYKPWICGADSDFIERAYHYGYSILSPGYNHIYFKRRIHNNSLTLKKDTMLAIGTNHKNGILRDKYKQQIKEDIKNGIIKIDTVTEKYTEII